jgi:crossover junction endodeoxyribonuclease RuvC
MRVIGIDPGTAITGYGIVEEGDDGSLQVIDYGAILTSSTESMHQRLRKLYINLTKIIHLHHPQSGAVEKLFFQRNVRTAISVGQARGVALLTLAIAELPVFEYAPLEIKQSVTSYGAADKRQVQQMVKTLLRMDQLPVPDDAADALAIAICHLHSARFLQIIDND